MSKPSNITEHKQIRQIRRVIRILDILGRQQTTNQQEVIDDTIRRLEVTILHIKSGNYKISDE